MRHAAWCAKSLWAAPCSLVGLLFGALLLLAGGTARRVSGTLEVAFRERIGQTGRLARKLPYRAMALGQVIVAVTQQELEHLREHERVHVRQYERWGIAFFPAYAGASLWQLLRGRRAYWDNPFEVEARRLSQPPQRQGGAQP